MSYLPFTLLAYLLNSMAVTIDKFLLVKSIPNPLTYIFYISAFSLLMLAALPFTHYPAANVFLLTSSSTLLWTVGAYLMFSAMRKGQLSRVVPVIGTLIPLILLTHASFFKTISQTQSLAVVILVLGLTFITLPDWPGALTKKEILLEILSAIFFAASYLVLKEAYLREDFLTVLVYSRLILIPLAALFLLIPHLRQIVLSVKKQNINFLSTIGLLFLFGQALGGAQQLLLIFSISLATPALVNSLQGVQYIFLFLFSLILSKKYPMIFAENYSFLILLSKLTGIGLIGAGLYLLSR